MQTVLEAAEAAAFERYSHALSQLAVPAGSQLDLLSASDAHRLAIEWRGIWFACLRQLGAGDAQAHVAVRRMAGLQ